MNAENILDEIKNFHCGSTGEIDKAPENVMVDSFDDFD